jgi:hypothetical protein
MRMSHLGRLTALAADDRGAALIMFAVFAPVAILLAAFAIDTGNWYLHKRHLQVQADAGALAAALEFQPCSNGTIEATARKYSGIAGTPLYNEQVGGTPAFNVHELINSKRYYGSPANPAPEDATAEEKPPCEADMVDVKLTETNLPWYWHPLSSVGYINAHARVEILQVTTTTGVEPLAVAETAPVAARAYFVNEDKNNEVIASTPLKDLGANAQGQDEWANSKEPLPVAVNKTNSTTAHIGVRIALSGNPNDTKCGDTYVKCFDEGATGPLLHIAGYTNEGAGTLIAPRARAVTLSYPAPDTCTDGYFSNSASNCTFTISAKVDYGSTNRTGVTVTPVVGGTTSPTALTYSTETGLWTGTATLPAGSGSKEISLLVKCKNEAGSACPTKEEKGTASDVQRIYAASAEHSGTIAGAWISEPGASEPVPGSRGADSYQVCEPADGNSCTHKLVVTVAVGGSLANAAGFSDPLRPLRWEGPQGVRVGCPPPASPSGSEYREHLAKGCAGNYTINTSDPNCTANTSPYDCLTAGLPGKDTGPTQQGIDERIEHKVGTQFYCPNNWQNNNGGGVPILPKDDSRIVQVFIMPYGSVNAEGKAVLASGEVPIQDFATFYVTGFPGDSCKGDPSTGNAEIVGHFIKYVNTINNGGGQKCIPNSLGECVAVLTR